MSTIAELVERFEAGDIEREEFIEELAEAEDYSVTGKFHGFDGYEPGSADLFVQVWMSGIITDAEATYIVLRWDERRKENDG